MASQPGTFNLQELADAGAPLVGGRLYTYAYGTTTQKTAYTDAAGTVAHTYTADGAGGQYIALNARGELPAPLYLLTGSYDLALKRADASTVWTRRADGQSSATDLSGAAGAALVGFIQAGTGAVSRTLQAKARERVSVDDFGAAGDGVTDDTAAFAAAAAALGATGGAVHFYAKHLIDGNLALPANVILRGKYDFDGSPGTNAAQPFAQMSALIVNSAATITLGSGAAVVGALLYRKGMTFPATDSSAFAGTAITVGGDDAGCERCTVLGFNKAFYSSGYARPRMSSLLFDCINGVEVTNCNDIPRLDNCHAWPFSTIAAGGVHTTIERTGTAFSIHDSVDWAKLTDCFAYGYARGFLVSNANSATLTGCGADDTYSGAPLHTGSIGFQVDGACTETRLIGCQSSAHGACGVYVNTLAGVVTQIIGCDLWSNGTHGVLIDSGDVILAGASTIRNVPNGVTVSVATSRVSIDESVRFDGVTTPINPTVSTANIRVRTVDAATLAAGSALAGANMTTQTIASASPLNLPATGEVFNVSGTTNFGTLNGGWAGRTVTLIFNSALSVFSSTGAAGAIRLNGSATFSAAAGSTLSLRYNGAQWYEIGRCA